MNSKKKKNQPQKNQPSIKEQLQAHRKKQEEERAAAQLSDIDPALLEHNDITLDVEYEVSMMARVWFRENSNFNAVLDLFIEVYKLQNHPKNDLVEQLIRYVMNTSYRILYPYNTFRFNTPRDFAIAKELLRYPAIETQADLERVLQYLGNSRVQFSTVNMEINNQLSYDIQSYVESKRERYGSKRLHYYHRTATNNALRKYYKSKNLIKFVDLQTITLEEMLEISNFERTLKRDMKNVNIEDDQLEEYGQTLLDVYKSDPRVLLSNKKLLINPRYYLLCNYIPQEKEALITTDIETFFKRTNANDILRQHRDELSRDLSESMSDKEKKEKMRMKLFVLYLRQKERNKPPFHELYIKDLDQDEMPEEFEPTHDSTPTKLTYKQKQVCERNSDHATNSESSASETTVIENFHTETIPMTLEQLLLPSDPSSSEIELASILAKAPQFVVKIKEATRIQFPNTFERLWTEDQKRCTFVHYLQYFLRNKPDPYRHLMQSTLEGAPLFNALKLFDDLVASIQQENFDNILATEVNFSPPNITSTQNALQEASIHPTKSDDVVFVHQSKDFAPVNENTIPKIKSEPLSDPLHIPVFSTPKKNTNDSEVLCWTQRDDVLTIDDSEEEESSMVKMLEDGMANEVGRDHYQMLLNQPSQQTPEAEADELIVAAYETVQQSPQFDIVQQIEQISVQKSPAVELTTSQTVLPEGTTFGRHDDEELRRTYELRTYQLYQEDKANAAAARKRKKQAEEKKDPPKKRPKRNAANPISYQDSEEEVTPFIFTSSTSTSTTSENGASSFLIELQRVSFKRDYIFEISIHLPQFACYDILIKDENIKHALNLSDIEWQTLLNNLCIVGQYEFINGQSVGGKFSQSYSSSINRQLDLYFSSISHIKAFQVIGNGISFTTQPLSSILSTANTSSAIDSNILKLIARQNCYK